MGYIVTLNLRSLWGCILCTVLTAALLLSACGNAATANSGAYKKYRADFTGLFDTHGYFLYYARSEAEFDRAFEEVYRVLEHLHTLFDIYHHYEGVNNLKTINDNAGIAPVSVDSELIALLCFARDAYRLSEGTVDISLGSVLSLWHEYREAGIRQPESAALPPVEALQAAAKLANMENLLIDEENQTVFLTEAGMLLDVGSIAKGYAAQQAVDAAKRSGFTSCLLDLGGNVVAAGQPAHRSTWGIGVQQPLPGALDLLDTVYVNDLSLVTSGDYQRYYEVDAIRYGHLIDPQTLMPANYYHAITVAHPDSAMADVLTTALFILPQEKGRALAEAYGAAVLWVMLDMTVVTNEPYKLISKTY